MLLRLIHCMQGAGFERADRLILRRELTCLSEQRQRVRRSLTPDQRLRFAQQVVHVRRRDTQQAIVLLE